MPVVESPLTLSAVLPPGIYARRARALIGRSAMVGRHIWLLIASGFVEPLLFLAVFGAGFGTMIGPVTGPDHHPMRYITFVAPALLAVSAMNGALHDATFNVFGKLRSKFYDTVLSTPLGTLDIVIGEMSWALIRGGMYSAGFLAVMLATGLVGPVAAVVCLAAALLVGASFAATGMLATTYLRSWQDYSFVTTATMVQFLFSTTFYPLSTYPKALQWAVQVFPLYQAIQLMRDITFDTVGPQTAVHIAYLLVLAAIAFVCAVRRLHRKLIS
ncbi:ABC transporter permease [Kitasatospora kazusensis]|uniref:Transport permease protein n=1 Tax=Kitasatospora kazusensis TaxID=407974 RepID=A0ABN2ZUR1_9ACTN